MFLSSVRVWWTDDGQSRSKYNAFVIQSRGKTSMTFPFSPQYIISRLRAQNNLARVVLPNYSPYAHLTSSLLLRRLDPLVLRWQAHLKWFNMNLTTFICCSEWQVAYNKTECRPNAVRAGQQGSTTNTNSCPRLTTITFKKILKFLLCLK